MRSLRMAAIASNVAFIIYAAIGNMLPILLLHSILLPMNIMTAGSKGPYAPIGHGKLAKS